MNNKKKTILFLLLSDILLLLISLFYNFFLFERGLVGNCFFREKVGIYCLACGGSRALSALFSLKIISSLILYPTIITSIIVIIYYEFRLLRNLFTSKPLPVSIFSKYFVLLIPTSIILNYLIKCIFLYAFGIDLIQIGASINF